MDTGRSLEVMWTGLIKECLFRPRADPHKVPGYWRPVIHRWLASLINCLIVDSTPSFSPISLDMLFTANRTNEGDDDGAAGSNHPGPSDPRPTGMAPGASSTWLLQSWERKWSSIVRTWRSWKVGDCENVEPSTVVWDGCERTA